MKEGQPYAIGAYAAGVFVVLYYWIKKDVVKSEPIFSIVAGTSAGAINAMLFLHVISNKTLD